MFYKRTGVNHPQNVNEHHFQQILKFSKLVTRFKKGRYHVGRNLIANVAVIFVPEVVGLHYCTWIWRAYMVFRI